jgi:hypothetical protein
MPSKADRRDAELRVLDAGPLEISSGIEAITPPTNLNKI